MLKNKIALTLAGSALLGSLLVAVPVFAATSTTPGTPGQSGTHLPAGKAGWGGGKMPPGVFGTVTAVSGTSITLTSKGFMMRGKPGSTTSTTAPAPTPTTYTVDASNATVTKNNAASSVSAIAVGDTLMVQGTVSGTSVTATKINDGMPMMRGGQGGPNGGAQGSPIQGNGEPVIGGAITAVSGTTLTVNAKAGVTYSVDASSAVIKKGNATSTVSAITVGDNVVVQGTVNGTSVVASSVMDSGAPKTGTGSTGGKGMGGFLGAIGGFFQHIFGFF